MSQTAALRWWRKINQITSQKRPSLFICLHPKFFLLLLPCRPVYLISVLMLEKGCEESETKKPAVKRAWSSSATCLFVYVSPYISATDRLCIIRKLVRLVGVDINIKRQRTVYEATCVPRQDTRVESSTLLECLIMKNVNCRNLLFNVLFWWCGCSEM